VTLPSTPPAHGAPAERAEPSRRIVSTCWCRRQRRCARHAHVAARAQGPSRQRRGRWPLALDSIAREKPDLAFVDIGLPDVDGYAIAREVRTRPGMESVVLVALTGYGQPDDQAQALSAGFDLHVTKPIAADHLDRVLSEFGGAREPAEASARG
jgi:two-component system CheB/CheR fusion protein